MPLNIRQIDFHTCYWNDEFYKEIKRNVEYNESLFNVSIDCMNNSEIF